MGLNGAQQSNAMVLQPDRAQGGELKEAALEELAPSESGKYVMFATHCFFVCFPFHCSWNFLEFECATCFGHIQINRLTLSCFIWFLCPMPCSLVECHSNLESIQFRSAQGVPNRVFQPPDLNCSIKACCENRAWVLQQLVRRCHMVRCSSLESLWPWLQFGHQIGAVWY